MRMIYAEIDVTDWPLDRSEHLGTKPKRWLRDPESGERWLMKDATHNTRADETSYRKGDDWAERIATGIADHLGLPAARTELAFRTPAESGSLGVISKSFLRRSEEDEKDEDDDEELVLGNQLLAPGGIGTHREGYTVQAVRLALQDVDPPLDVDSDLSAWDVFAGYLLLDALIGNRDRHEENWAVIRRDDSRRLAPTFDHASSLGFQLDDRERERRLTTADSGYTPEVWAGRAKSKFYLEPRLVDVAIEACRMLDSGVRDRLLERCEDTDRLIEPVWLVPERRMTQPAREFAERVLRCNHRRVMTAWSP